MQIAIKVIEPELQCRPSSVLLRGGVCVHSRYICSQRSEPHGENSSIHFYCNKMTSHTVVCCFMSEPSRQTNANELASSNYKIQLCIIAVSSSYLRRDRHTRTANASTYLCLDKYKLQSDIFSRHDTEYLLLFIRKTIC